MTKSPRADRRGYTQQTFMIYHCRLSCFLLHVCLFCMLANFLSLCVHVLGNNSSAYVFAVEAIAPDAISESRVKITISQRDPEFAQCPCWPNGGRKLETVERAAYRVGRRGRISYLLQYSFRELIQRACLPRCDAVLTMYRCPSGIETFIKRCSCCCLQFVFWLHFAWVVDDAKCIVVTRVCVSVCVCLSACPHYCTDRDVTWGSGSGCPLVVHYWADLQSVHGLRCYGNIKRTLVTSLRPSRNMTS